LRENIEVLLVAVVVAMAVRTYFLQPFKIPTGSMQPTLYGIHSPAAEFPPQPTDVSVNPVTWLLWGRGKGPEGTRITGDHIFVDKVTYNFRKPKRGEVIVFQTQGIVGLDQDKFYIKRCAGLPGERIDIDPPFLYADGKKVEGRPFERIYSLQDGYQGYTYPHGRGPYALASGHAGFLLKPKCYFALGDNSPNSLDGRYWGCVPEANLVGKAFLTYWPFSKRWGPVR
jgi:signal peptidase I